MEGRKSQTIRIVFALQPPSVPAREKTINGSVWRVQPVTSSLSAFEALQSIVSVVRRLGRDTTFDDYGKQVPAERMLRRVEKQGRWRGHLETADFYLQFGVVGPHEHCFVTIEELKPGAAGSWDVWVEPFLSKEGFVQASIYDTEYDRWQNAESLQLYEFAGRDYSHLPLIPKDVPSPVHTMMVEISRNPGRWSLEQGYVEAIGSVMWLSDIFFERVGMDHKDRLASAEWVGLSEPAPGIVRIQATESCFVDEITAKTQDRLRALLYR